MPFAPGSRTTWSRGLIADGLGGRLGQNVVVDNRPGAGTLLGTRAAAAAEPDGHTLLLNSSSLLVAPAMYKDRRSIRSRASSRSPTWSGRRGSRSLPARCRRARFTEFVAYTKANPGKLIFAYTPGTAPQLVGEWLKVKTGMDVTSVAYRGGAQVMADMMGGRIHLYIAPATTLLPLIEQGKFRPIAYWSAQRSPQFPEVPTMIESGFPGSRSATGSGCSRPPARRARSSSD